MPKCPKCEHQSFALTELNVQGSRYRMYAVECSNYTCHAVVGVTEYYDSGSLIKEQEKKLADLASQVSRIQRSVSQMEAYLSRLGH